MYVSTRVILKGNCHKLIYIWNTLKTELDNSGGQVAMAPIYTYIYIYMFRRRNYNFEIKYCKLMYFPSVNV
jgi:hypothetical protein